MSKVKIVKFPRLRTYFNEYGTDVWTTGGTILLYKMYYIEIIAEKIYYSATYFKGKYVIALNSI